MKLTHKIVITYVLLFLSAVSFTILTIWSSTTIKFHVERAELAHHSYQEHLKLSNTTYQLFKEFADNLLIGDQQVNQREQKLLADLKSQFFLIKKIITDEIEMVGSEEIEELDELANLENIIFSVIEDYIDLRNDISKSGLLYNNKALTTMLDGRIDEQINDAINDALEEEMSEVVETKEEVEELLRRVKYLTIFFVSVAFLMLMASMYFVTKNISRPLQSIIQGAKRFAEGDWKYRINVAVKGELKDVADSFNSTAQVAGEQEENLTDDNERLLENVREQTSELRVAMLDLEEQSKLRQRLLADVSHELRTPLTVIQGEVDVALRGQDKTVIEYKDALSRVGDAAKHTASLVNDVLFVARKETGQTRLVLSNNDVVDVIENCIETFGTILKEKNIHVSLEKNIESEVFVFDKKRIRQVLLILFENTFKYGSNATKLDLYLEEKEQEYILTVTDDGPGIKAGDIPQLFERFYRGAGTSGHYNTGSGLGLPVAKSIIEAHKGSIGVQSEFGNGVAFTIMLPKNNKVNE